MKSLLANCMNKSVQVASAAIFGDTKPRICKLVGLEEGGVWLACDELTKMVYRNVEGATAAVFVPLAQITYLVADATPPARALEAASPSPTRSKTRSQAHHENARTRPGEKR